MPLLLSFNPTPLVQSSENLAGNGPFPCETGCSPLSSSHPALRKLEASPTFLPPTPLTLFHHHHFFLPLPSVPAPWEKPQILTPGRPHVS